MSKPTAHLHLIVSAKIDNPPGPDDVNYVSQVMLDLVNHVRMKVLVQPATIYCEDFENEGITSTVILSTSHCSMHIWDQLKKFEFDIFSCAPYTTKEVIDFLKSKFKLSNIKYKFLDRENDLIELESSNLDIN